MPVYEATNPKGGQGYHLGLLVLTKTNPFIPGDVANASTYDYPVVFKTVPGAWSTRVLSGDPELEDAVVETALELEAMGVRGISSDCGFFMNYQDVVRKKVKVPVFMSSLLSLPMIDSILGKGRSIGCVTANSVSLGNRILSLTGVPAGRTIRVKGLQDMPEWQAVIGKQGPYLDSEKITAEVVQLAKELKEEDPNMGAIVLECSLLPVYAKPVQEATGLPVFDFLNIIDYYERGIFARNRVGHA
ncbi:MAG: aspartate/glutamate racemase family protein [Rhodospirillales bacterium]|nr:aspartate/glutamate racemase family protein [Rhodospirillales bacterium]